MDELIFNKIYVKNEADPLEKEFHEGMSQTETHCQEYYIEITNPTDRDIYIGRLSLFSMDSLKDAHLSDNSLIFRSGRHKNDMPGVAEFGCFDESMKDLTGGMTETGDKAEGSGLKIVSDHITVIGRDKDYLVISFETCKNQTFETSITVNEKGEFSGLKSEVIFNIYIKAGEKLKSEIIRIERRDDANKAITDFAKRRAVSYGSRNSRRKAVFCTWYYYGLTVNYTDVKTNLKIMHEKKLPFDVFQLDEGWEITLGEWEKNEKFPIEMKDLADEIKEAGYEAGIWTSPFVAKESATVWKEHPDWILKDKSGNPCIFPMNDTEYYIFDITIRETHRYFYELYRKLTFDWGFTYHKLDFTRAAVIIEDADYSDKYSTLPECYVEAVKAIRAGMGEDSYFLMCGGLYDPLIGIVDAQRTGSDVLSMWSSNINKDGKTAPYTIKQNLNRFYMNYWWNNDPDALMVRRNENMERNLRLTYGLLNDEEVKTVVINQFLGGGLICSTEPLDKIDDERLYELRRILPIIDMQVEPLNIMEQKRFPENAIVRFKDKKSILIARINWSDDKDMKVELNITEEIGHELQDCDSYILCDYYSGEYKTGLHIGDCVDMGYIKPHGATILKLYATGIKKSDAANPDTIAYNDIALSDEIMIKSDGHYSMGRELEIADDGQSKPLIDWNYQCNYEFLGKNL